MSDACPSCATPLPADRARCPKCGKVDLERARAIGRAGAEAVKKGRGALVATRLLLYGSLVTAFLVVGIEFLLPVATVWRAAAQQVLFVMLIGAGLSALGPGSFAASLGARVRGSHFLRTIGTGVLAGVVWRGWDVLQDLVFGFDRPWRLTAAAFWTLEFLAPTVLLEMLCRGVTWEALRRFRTPRVRLIATAAQFAVIEAIVGRPSALPGMFVVGLLLGRLRERTESLAPSIAAHLLARGVAFLLAIPIGG